jgi:hypothetical protein
MVIEVDDNFVLVMLETLRTCANAVEMNGPASYMLAQELADLGKPMEAITLGELQAALDHVDVRYHRMEDRCRKLMSAAAPNRSVLRKVMKGRVRIDGLDFTAPELADLDGKTIQVDLPEEGQSYSLVAQVVDSETGGSMNAFQIHHIVLNIKRSRS